MQIQHYTPTQTVLQEDQQAIQAGFTYNITAMAVYEARVPLSTILHVAQELHIPVQRSTIRGAQWFTTKDGYKKLQAYLTQETV